MKMFPSYIWLAACRGQGFTESVHRFQAASPLSNKSDIYLIFFSQGKSNREPIVAVHSSVVFLIITSRFYWMADHRQALFDSRPPWISLKPPVLHFPFPRGLALLSVYQCWPKWLPDERLMSWSVACGLERERVFSEAAVRRNGRRTNNHRRLFRAHIHTLERRKLVQSKTECFSQDTNCAQPRCSVVCVWHQSVWLSRLGLSYTR